MITIGSDVEVAVHNEEGIPIDVTGMLGGSKENPVWFDNFNIQEDNVNAEYAINPVENMDDWILYHSQAINKVRELLPEGHGILFNASTQYPSRNIASDNAKKFGCDTDYSAWSGSPNASPSSDRAGNMRTCGGHIHVGSTWTWADQDQFNRWKINLVKWMDVFLGIPSMFMDMDTERRKLYGRAGSYRPKSYGVEYRTLSNFWAQDKEGMEWAYNQTMKAIEHCQMDIATTIPNLTRIPSCIDRYDLTDAETAFNWLTKEGIL